MSVVVVGYLPKPEGEAAVRAGVAEAGRRNARLVVVNAQRPGVIEQAHAERLDELRSELATTGVEHQIRELVRGQEPADDLIAVAREVDAELIVIGLRRRTAVGKLILGSNAQRILLDAPCAVLAVKP